MSINDNDDRAVEYAAKHGALDIDQKGARKLKVVAADGSVRRETNAAEVLAALATAAEIEAVLRPGELPRCVVARRKIGLPDLCCVCSAALGMSRVVVAKRSTRPPHEWLCKLCAIRSRAKPPPDVEHCSACARPLSNNARQVSQRKRARAKGVFSGLCTPCRTGLMGRTIDPAARGQRSRVARLKASKDDLRKMMRRAQAGITKEIRAAAGKKKTANSAHGGIFRQGKWWVARVKGKSSKRVLMKIGLVAELSREEARTAFARMRPVVPMPQCDTQEAA